MKIALAQIASAPGDVERNIARHLDVARRLDGQNAGLVVFPELSLTGYEPRLAQSCALDVDDPRLACFQNLVDATGLSVALGAPHESGGLPMIAMLIYVERRRPLVVGKRFLHADETPWFSPATRGATVLDHPVRAGLAICYEITIEEHTDALVDAGAEIYLASVAKTQHGVEEACSILAATARRHDVPALLVNCVGPCEGAVGGGGSMVVDRAGRLVERLGESDEALLVFDIEHETRWTVPL